MQHVLMANVVLVRMHDTIDGSTSQYTIMARAIMARAAHPHYLLHVVSVQAGTRLGARRHG